jgi:hypothetical protein
MGFADFAPVNTYNIIYNIYDFTGNAFAAQTQCHASGRFGI